MSDPTPDEFLGLSSMERIDMLNIKHEQAMEIKKAELASQERRAKVSLKQARTTMWRSVIIGFFVCVVCLGLAAGFVYIVTRPSTPGDYRKSDAYREQRCYDTGGVWLDSDILSGGHSYCVYPGKPAKDQVPK
jgi:hypothetical protein